MTNEEALKHFKSLQKRYTTQHNGVMCEKVKVAIEALEKQIPKKRRKFEDNYKSFSFDCPECGGYLVSEIDGELCAGQRYKYCHRCGQAIDWSDDE